MTDRAQIGDYVQIERVVLPAGERAPQVPEDTAAVPLVMRVKGFALGDATVGDEIEVRTVIGRRVSGRLVAVNPSYEHDFGRVVPELLPVGPEAKALIRGTGEGPEGGELR